MKSYDVDPDIMLQAIRKARREGVVDGQVVVIEAFHAQHSPTPSVAFYWQFNVRAREVIYHGVTSISYAAA